MSAREPSAAVLAYAAAFLDAASARAPSELAADGRRIALIAALLRERAGVNVEGLDVRVVAAVDRAQKLFPDGRADRDQFEAAIRMLEICARNSPAGAPLLLEVAAWLREWAR